MAQPSPSTADFTQRRRILQQGELAHNGIAGEDARLYTDREHSIALAVALGQLLKARGLGSVGVAITFMGKEPAWAFTSVGFVPKGEAGTLTHGEGTGVLVGIEGAVAMEEWPRGANSDGETYRTFWLPVDGTLPLWKKLSNYFPADEWKTGAQEVAERLLAAHRESLSSHWIALGGGVA